MNQPEHILRVLDRHLAKPTRLVLYGRAALALGYPDAQLIISPGWLQHLVPIPMQGLRFLDRKRPSTEDLILTKMMRIDPQDRSDIHFLLGHSCLNSNTLEDVLKSANVPPIAEIDEAFQENSRWLRALLPGG